VTEEHFARNEGIVVKGDLKAGAIAVGQYAIARNEVAAADARLQERGLEEVRLRLDELIREIAEQRGLLVAPSTVDAAAQNIAGELAKEKPDKSLLTVLLDGLATSARSVAGVLTAAEALRAAITAFL
jgi:hypothetical protein